MYTLATIVVLVTLLVFAGISYQFVEMKSDALRFPPPGKMVDIGGGERLHIHVTGNGEPTVILEAGIAATSLSWQLVQPLVSEFATTASYDRAGLGWSEQTSAPRTPSAIARQLQVLLERAELQPPFVLVGHSFGGLVVQKYADLFPDQVRGLVLVDPLSPNEWHNPDARARRMLWGGTHLSRRGRFLARIGVVRACMNSLLRGGAGAARTTGLLVSGRTAASLMDRLAGEVRKLPHESWPAIASHWSNPKCFEAMARHLELLPVSSNEAMALQPLSVPATVIIAEHVARAGVDPAPALPDATRIVAWGCGHWVHLDAADLVAGAVRDLIARTT